MAIVVINGALILPMYLGRDIKSSAPICRLLMANVYTQNMEHDKLLSYILSETPDVIVLLEVNRRWMNALDTLRASYPFYIEAPSSDNFGIAFYSKLPVSAKTIKVIGDAQVSSIHAVVIHDGHPLNIIGTHPLPPGGKMYWKWRNDQLDKVASYVALLKGHSVLIGDLNTTPWSHYFRKLIKNSGLRNSSKGFGLNASWPSFVMPFGIPIDHCLVSQGITVNDRRTGTTIGSDHLPLIVDIAIKEP